MCGVVTKAKYVEILYFKQFFKCFVFVENNDKSRNKHLKNYFDISVVVDIGCGDTKK